MSNGRGGRPSLRDDVAQMHGEIERHITLLPEQEEVLRELEAQVDVALGHLREAHRARFKARLKMGRALAEVKRRKLYRDWGTWDVYIPERFGITARRADMLIEAWDTWRALKRGGSEYQPHSVNELEALAGLTPEQVVAVAEAALKVKEDEARPRGKPAGRPQANDLRKLADTVRNDAAQVTAAQVEAKRQKELLESALAIIRQMKPATVQALVARIQSR